MLEDPDGWHLYEGPRTEGGAHGGRLLTTVRETGTGEGVLVVREKVFEGFEAD